MNSFLSAEELDSLGFRAIGRNCRISRFCRIYGAGSISLGDSVRIDDFTILSGEIIIGNYVHIASHCTLHAGTGEGQIIMGDFSGLSARVSVYGHSDDYSGASMTNPTIPRQFTKVVAQDVAIGRHAIVGASSVILPGANVGEGTAVGAMTLVKGNLDPFKIYAGNPARFVRSRSTGFLEYEKQLREGIQETLA